MMITDVINVNFKNLDKFGYLETTILHLDLWQNKKKEETTGL